jgi:hypothetical protein
MESFQCHGFGWGKADFVSPADGILGQRQCPGIQLRSDYAGGERRVPVNVANGKHGRVLGFQHGFDPLELSLVGGKVSATDLLNLSVGKILPLGVSVRTPGVLKIGGHDAFKAVPVRSGKHRGAQLLDRVPKSQPETGNTL